MCKAFRYQSVSSQKSSQSGFIQAALLFGIALMTAVLGGFALANRSPTSQTDVEQAKVNASVVLKQASDIRDGVARYSSDFGSSSVVSIMSFDADGNDGLFNPASRYASPQIMPSGAFNVALDEVADDINAPGALVAGHWYINKNVVGNGLGSGADDPMVILPRLREDVCARINTLLFGDSAIPASGAVINNWITDGVVDLDTANVADGWPEGCVSTNDTPPRYVYFKAVQEN